MNAIVTPAELITDCLTGSVRRLLGGVHSLTSARAVIVCVDPSWIHVKFSTPPGALPAPWEADDAVGWMRAPLGQEPKLRDSSADPVLVVVGVGEREIVAINALAIDEIGVTCHDRAALIGNWLLQAQIQDQDADEASLAGVRLTESPDATIVVADPIVDGQVPGWVDVLAEGTSWPVRPLRLGGVDDGDLDQYDPEAEQPVGVEHSDTEAACESSVSVIDGSPGPQTAVAQQKEGQDAPVEATGTMTVFGRFSVVDAEGAALQPMQQQIVGAIAFNQPIPTAELCEMLYGAGVDRQKSFHVAMSKIRRRGLQPVATDEGYCIDINSDWSRFTRSVTIDPSTAETEKLKAAADLITGPLFGTQVPPWASDHVAPMADLVAQTCRELAARNVDQPDLALHYARRGLTVSPGQDELVAICSMLTTGEWNKDQDGEVTA